MSESIPRVVPEEPRCASEDAIARGRLFGVLEPALYEELKAIASQWMAHERSNHTLQTTGLLNEALIRLSTARKIEIDPAHRVSFFAAASTTMRRVLIDHARARRADRRGGGAGRESLNEDGGISVPLQGPGGRETPLDIVALDDLLSELQRRHARAARVVELRVFGGLSVPEAAVELEVSPRTVDGDWQFACAWLAVQMKAG